MEHELLTLEFGRGAVAYEGRTAPAGTLGCEALNIPDAVIASLNEPCAVLNEFIAALGMLSVTDELLERAHGAALQLLNAMLEMEPFSHLDRDFYAPGIADAFTPEAIEQVRALNMAMLTRGLAAAQEPSLRKGALLSKIAPVLAQLAFSLAEYKRAMAALAEAINADDVERTPDGFATAFSAHFSASNDSLMALANASVQYISAGEPPQLLRRMNYVSFVGLLRSDFYEGLIIPRAAKMRCLRALVPHSRRAPHEVLRRARSRRRTRQNVPPGRSHARARAARARRRPPAESDIQPTAQHYFAEPAPRETRRGHGGRHA